MIREICNILCRRRNKTKKELDELKQVLAYGTELDIQYYQIKYKKELERK